MADRITDFLPPPSSPTISSVSSSDFDTESTGSFFHDRSISLGTLMGVSFPPIAFRASSRHQHHASPAASTPRGARPTRKRPNLGGLPSPSSSEECRLCRRRRSWRWWRLCRDDEDGGAYGGDARPSSLGDFLEVERRFYGAAPELDIVAVPPPSHPAPERNERLLFADGRVLPPPAADDPEDERTASGGAVLCSLTGICSGGVDKSS